VRRCWLTIAIVLALLAGPAGRPAFAQQRRWARQHPLMTHRQNVRAQARANQNKSEGTPAGKNHAAEGGRGLANARGLAGLPPKWVENLRDRSPEEQEQFMRNNQRFQSLPPWRQEQIRRNLQKWNSLSPTERDAMRDRERTWNQMTPGQRQYAQNVLLPKLQAMPPYRRQLIMGRMHTLQGMSPADREAALNDPQFMRGLSPDEQSTLRDLNSFRNPVSP
jgi:Protein of unknown function (DUF3106)